MEAGSGWFVDCVIIATQSLSALMFRLIFDFRLHSYFGELRDSRLQTFGKIPNAPTRPRISSFSSTSLLDIRKNFTQIVIFIVIIINIISHLFGGVFSFIIVVVCDVGWKWKIVFRHAARGLARRLANREAKMERQGNSFPLAGELRGGKFPVASV
jgi:hypothetical protein